LLARRVFISAPRRNSHLAGWSARAPTTTRGGACAPQTRNAARRTVSRICAPRSPR
jgi:hypothetical protein